MNNNINSIAKLAAASSVLSAPLVSLACSGALSTAAVYGLSVAISATVAVGYLAVRHRNQVAGDAAAVPA
ncbi:hypothetical protein [Aminobacter sp. MSH1]|uniref:hypothetical protein n=1 Tax=Aminobacter sp. MSH1 TaxID=374606 RepID=UPI000D33BCB8|nr:hypothetical protein [Aminobacter sp. MSH1]